MSMSKQDYEVIAEELRRTRPEESGMSQRLAQWVLTRDAIADALNRKNLRFQRELFINWTERPFNARSQW